MQVILTSYHQDFILSRDSREEIVLFVFDYEIVYSIKSETENDDYEVLGVL